MYRMELIAALCFTGFLIGCWSYLIAGVFVYPKEVLGLWGQFINHVLWGKPSVPDYTKLEGWRLIVYKYTYCPICLAGVISLVLSVFPSDYINWYSDFIILGAFSMITARYLEKTL